MRARKGLEEICAVHVLLSVWEPSQAQPQARPRLKVDPWCAKRTYSDREACDGQIIFQDTAEAYVYQIIITEAGSLGSHNSR